MAATSKKGLRVLEVFETPGGLEIQILDENGRGLTTTIPQEVVEPKHNQFTVTRLEEETLKIVYTGGERREYEATIKR